MKDYKLLLCTTELNSLLTKQSGQKDETKLFDVHLLLRIFYLTTFDETPSMLGFVSNLFTENGLRKMLHCGNNCFYETA